MSAKIFSVEIMSAIIFSAILKLLAITTQKTKRNLTITYLSVHLENNERVYFTENIFLKRLSSPKATSLLFFFDFCTRD
jgi:hypothetical protein